MSDMEGIAGVTKWAETTGGEPLHGERSRLYSQFSFTFVRDLG
jgi:hypothetical protein